jgi:hypothetical protein
MVLRPLCALALWAGTAFLLLADTGRLPAEPADTTAKVRNEIASQQEVMARQFREVEQTMLRLAQRLEASGKPQDRDKAAVLRKALDYAGKEGVRLKFDHLAGVLRQAGTPVLADVEHALAQNQALGDDLRTILKIILDNDPAADHKAETAWLDGMVKKLDEIIRAEKKLREQFGDKDKDKKELYGEQKRIGRATADLAKEIHQRLDEPRPEAGDHVETAIDKEKGAAGKIAGGDSPGAGKDADDAIDHLEQVRDYFGKLVRQHREEEEEENRKTMLVYCERMLKLQTAVHDATVALHGDVLARPDRKAVRADEHKALALADKEGDILKDAGAAIKLLEDDGTVVAFLEVFKQVRDDLEVIRRRLARTDTGTVTQSIETDVIATLKEMIDALKQKGAEVCTKCDPPKPPFDGGEIDPGPHPVPPLVEKLAELKMLRAMQQRVNDRTATYGQTYRREQADAPDIRKELKELAGRQGRVRETVRNMEKVQAKGE